MTVESIARWLGRHATYELWPPEVRTKLGTVPPTQERKVLHFMHVLSAEGECPRPP